MRLHLVFGRPLLILLLLLSLPFHAGAKSSKVLDLADTIASNRILTKFAALMQASDQGVFLSSRGPFTVFAPTDSAFSRLPAGTFEMLLLPENKDTLQRLVLYHIFSGKSTSAKDLATVKSLISCEGLPWVIKKGRSGTQLVQKAKIVHADIHCLNGVLHEIDTILVPSDSPLSSLVSGTPPTSVVAPATNETAVPAVIGIPTPMQTNAPAAGSND